MRRMMVGLLALVAIGGCDDGDTAGGVLDAAPPLDAALDAGSDAEPDAALDAEMPGPWPVQMAPSPLSAFAASHPAALGHLSRWHTHVEGPERSDVAHRGSFGVGNGHLFGFVGLADPLNTLHSLVGPVYERDDRFFGDVSVLLLDAGQVPEDAPDVLFDEEWAGRSLSAPVALTGARLGGLWLETVDFAPLTDGPASLCFLRVLTVYNAGAAASVGKTLWVAPYHEADLQGELLVEVAGERTLLTGFVGGGGQASPQGLAWTLPELAPGAEVTKTVALCAAMGAQEALPALDVDALMEETATRFAARSAPWIQAEVPDPMVADLMDGLKMTLAVQTTAAGATCPMSQYTRTWARDNIGPAVGWMAVGGHEEMRGMMDYLYGAILLSGDLSNSYDADLDLSNLPDAPDWDAMAPLSGRVGGETPSYMVWMYDLWYRHTGSLTRIRDRWGFIRRCTLAQEFNEEGLLPYTGDETFRTAMNATFGLDLETAHHENAWSPNSALLWLGAAKGFIRMATALEMPEDIAAAEARRVQVDATIWDRYLLVDGCLSGFIDRETDEAWPAPFEDEQLKLTWAGGFSGDDPRVQTALDCLVGRVNFSPGVLQSPPHERYDYFPPFPVGDGVFTGMLPGYTLSAFSDAGHPQAEAAFYAMGPAATTSGNYQEYGKRGDGGVTIIYDPGGAIGDYSAKFRPWEGGINLAAMYQYLLGFEPDAAGKTISLRPNLPTAWPDMTFRGLRVGDERFDAVFERTAFGTRLTLTSHSAEAYQVSVRWGRNEPTTHTLAAGGTVVVEQP